MKMIYKHANEIHSRKEGFAISLLKKWEILEVGNGLQGWNGTERNVTSFTSARELFTIC